MAEHEEFDFSSVDWGKMEHDFEPQGPGPQISFREISPEMIAKRILRDVAPCKIAGEAAQMLGMAPASEEVDDLEHDESHARLALTNPIAPFIEAMSVNAAQGVVASILVTNDAELSEEERQESVDRLVPVIVMSTAAIIGNLMDIGLLHLPHFGTIMYGAE